jgi:glycolate oxidase FAD binding subunit
MNRLAAGPFPLSGASWRRGRLDIRLSGARREVEEAASELAGELGNACQREDDGHWVRLREHQSGFFQASGSLWRLSIPPATPPLPLASECLVEWGGAQRWYRGEGSQDLIRSVARRVGGHATLFRRAEGTEGGSCTFQPLPAGLQKLQRALKKAFDPQAIFNPHRMHRDW